jgi:hypothetical protein
VSDETPAELAEIRVQEDNLYREETYTDLRVATIRRLVPVKRDGSPDPSRPELYSGQTNLMSQAGPLPVECPLEATSIDEAIDKFPEAIQAAVERLIEEAKEIRKREASRIVVPGQMPGGGLGGGGIIG